MEIKLQELFKSVNEWLKFMETKNAVLLAIYGVLLGTAASLIKDSSGYLKPTLLWGVIPCLLLSLLVLLVSFSPINDKFFKTKHELKKTDLDNINLLYYGDLMKLEAHSLLELLYRSYKKEIPQVFEKPEIDYANQVIVNSSITHKKQRCFSIVMVINLYGMAISVCVYLLNVILAQTS